MAVPEVFGVTVIGDWRRGRRARGHLTVCGGRPFSHLVETIREQWAGPAFSALVELPVPTVGSAMIGQLVPGVRRVVMTAVSHAGAESAWISSVAQPFVIANADRRNNLQRHVVQNDWPAQDYRNPLF